MSYDIYLKKDDQVVNLRINHQITGGTYCLGGTTKAWLNVSYNYSKFLYEALGENGIREIYGKTALVGAQLLAQGIQRLLDLYGVDETAKLDDDYWQPTVGNTVKAMSDLIYLGTVTYAECPEAIWDGD
jgi:hypothetical protein